MLGFGLEMRRTYLAIVNVHPLGLAGKAGKRG
jgi:hypothetical protein